MPNNQNNLSKQPHTHGIKSDQNMSFTQWSEQFMKEVQQSAKGFTDGFQRLLQESNQRYQVACQKIESLQKELQGAKAEIEDLKLEKQSKETVKKADIATGVHQDKTEKKQQQAENPQIQGESQTSPQTKNQKGISNQQAQHIDHATQEIVDLLDGWVNPIQCANCKKMKKSYEAKISSIKSIVQDERQKNIEYVQMLSAQINKRRAEKANINQAISRQKARIQDYKRNYKPPPFDY